ncbi:MAG: PKD domain-containing protein [Phycisphaerales bacterium]
MVRVSAVLVSSLVVAGSAGALAAGEPEVPCADAPQVPCDGSGFSDPATSDFAACWDPAFPPSPEVMAAFTRAMQQNQQFNANTRWGVSGGIGDPVTITWSLVPDGTFVESNRAGEPSENSDLFARMDALFAGNRALWIAQFEACFARWTALTGVNFVRVTNGVNDWDDGALWGTAEGPTRGHIRIAMKDIDGGNGVLAYAFYPTVGDIVIDRAENWASSGGTYRFFRNTLMHEVGHTLGFAHVCPQTNTKLMEPFNSTAYDGPQQDEIRGGQYYYGDIYEPNASAANATTMGALTPGVTTTFGITPAPSLANTATMSISDNGDTDYYRFSVDQPRLVDVTITPFGSSYVDVDQNADGSCQGSGFTVNALAISNLVLQVQTNNGGVTWITQDATIAGSAETVNDVLVSPPGNFIVRVSQNGAPAIGDTQLYRLTIKAESTALTVTATDGAFTDRVGLTWTAIPNATAYRIIRNTANQQLGGSIIYEGPNGSFDDVTAVPGVTYYYFLRAQQAGSNSFRDVNIAGESGVRAVPPAPPTANAGPDQNLSDNDGNSVELVTLNGGASTDTDGTITNYRWNEGVTVLAQGASATANVNLATGVHTITLTVTDNSGLTGTDTVVVDVNARPAADAGGDQTVVDSDNSGAEGVTLDGSLSSDGDGTITEYRWNEGVTVLAQGAAATANVSLAVGVHTITLTTTDNDGATSADTTIITVEPAPPPTCPWQADGCIGDYNNDGAIDGDDVIGFFEAWDTNGECADLDASGSVDGDDVIVFFEVWDTNGGSLPGC